MKSRSFLIRRLQHPPKTTANSLPHRRSIGTGVFPVRSDRSRRAGVSLWVVLLLLATISSAGLLIYRYFRAGKQTLFPAVIRHTVARGTFEHTVVERGEVESSSNVEVRCMVKARNAAGTTILEVREEGTMVKPGDVVVKLDATALDQERIQQQIACNTKEAAMIEARNSFEAAIIAKKEYEEGTFFQEEQAAKSEILIAEENLRRAREYVLYSERLASRGYVTAQQLEGDQFAVEKALTELETGKTKLRVLQQYTKPKMLKELDSAIKSAEAKWKSEQSSHELELSKLKELEQQIELCTIRAPQSGQVIYANDRNFRGGGTDFVVEPGAVVRENQTIFRLPDNTRMQVKAKINEARVTLVQAKMPARIRLDALGDELFEGSVTRVNEYPEPSSWFSSQVKEYATYVKIANPPARIRPGLTAEVTIQIQLVEDAVMVPVQAVFERKGEYASMVSAGTTWELRPIEIAATNDKFVLVESGLDEGEVVALNPRELLVPLKIDVPPTGRQVAGSGRGRPGPAR